MFFVYKSVNTIKHKLCKKIVSYRQPLLTNTRPRSLQIDVHGRKFRFGLTGRENIKFFKIILDVLGK